MAASVLLKSSPKKGIHPGDIPLSLRMSGQFCTTRISINTGIRASLFLLELKSWSTKSSSYRMFRASRYATNRSENVCSRWSASIIALLSMRRSSQSVIAVPDPMRQGCLAKPRSPKNSSLLNMPRVASLPPGQMYLASPLTVAASAVAGYIVEYEPSNANDLVSA